MDEREFYFNEYIQAMEELLSYNPDLLKLYKSLPQAPNGKAEDIQHLAHSLQRMASQRKEMEMIIKLGGSILCEKAPRLAVYAETGLKFAQALLRKIPESFKTEDQPIYVFWKCFELEYLRLIKIFSMAGNIPKDIADMADQIIIADD